MGSGVRFAKLGQLTKRLRPVSLLTRITAIILILDAFVLGLAGMSTYGNRQQYTLRAEIISRNMSAILAETVAGYIDRIDTALQVIVDQTERERVLGTGDAAYADDILRRAYERVPEVTGFSIVDASGVTRNASAGLATGPEVNLADRDYFQVLRDNPDAGLVISPPLMGRVSKAWVIVLARRVNTADGGFGGIAYSSMPLPLISALFAGVDLGPSDAIALRGPLPNLGIIARFPETVGGVPAIGNQAVSPELQAMTVANPERGTYIARAGIDGIERVLSYHKVAEYPYYLVVGLSTAQLVAQWRHESLQVAGITLVFVILTAGGGWFVLVSLRARRALQGQLKLIEFAFNHQAEAVLLLDRHGDVVSGNAAAAGLFQRDLATLRGVGVWDLGIGVARADWGQHWRQLLQGEPVTQTSEIRRADASPVPAVVTANYFAFGAEEFEVAIIRDIGEQVRHEQDMHDALAVSQSLGAALARKNQELARFAEILAHHLQEPVRQQHIFAQHLARRLPRPVAPEVQQSLDAILNAAQRHRALLGDAQAYLAFDSATAAAAPVCGDDGLDRALDRLHGRIVETQAVVERAPLPPLPINPAALAEVFFTVIDNALTYTRPGVPPWVRIAAEQRDGETVVTVTDAGIGIPAEFRDRVFWVFERLNTRSGQSGTGIGLALAKKIIEDAGGRIWIEQPEAPGTRICFTLPGA